MSKSQIIEGIKLSAACPNFKGDFSHLLPSYFGQNKITIRPSWVFPAASEDAVVEFWLMVVQDAYRRKHIALCIDIIGVLGGEEDNLSLENKRKIQEVMDLFTQ